MEITPLRGVKIKLTLIFSILLSLVFANRAVFADENLSLSVSPDTITLETVPEIFTSGSQTITVETDSSAGYNVSLSTTGSSSALINQSDSSITIPTFTLPSGSSSVPASSTGYGYGYSVDGGLNYMSIPEPNHDKQIFDVSSSGVHQHVLTFGSLVPTSQQYGVYSNTIEIYAVANLLPCSSNNICYYGNGDDRTGTMDDQIVNPTSESVMLTSPNFSRPGYGFAGWNTETDGSGINYGPNQTILTSDLPAGGLQLYANWVQSAGDLQSWNGCDDLEEEEEITALTDTRDNNTYAVAKYADGQCWMMENLRLDLSDPDLEISGLNTNNPTIDFANSINTLPPDPRPSSSDSFCESNTANCINKILFNTNNTNRNFTASYDANDATSSWYSYGNYYNWYTATAGNGTYSMSNPGIPAEGDICPAGWRLPTSYGEAGDLAKLDIAKGGSGRNPTTSGTAAGIAASKRWRTYPLNFIYSGEQRDGTGYNRNVSSSYAAKNNLSAERTTNLWIKADGTYMNSNSTLKYRGQTIRCIINNGYKEIGNIHYDANGGSGTMPDDVDVDLGIAVAANNAFTKDHASFIGWNTKADGTGVSVAEGGSVATAANHMGIVEGGTLTLYANWKIQYSLIYDGNGADAGSMSAANIYGLNSGSRTLVASNFSRNNYGFAGWSLDPLAATKLANGEAVNIYGPNETITVDNAFLSNADADKQIFLYAVWIENSTTHSSMQTFGATECANMQLNSVIALKDSRDNNVYSVAKLKDENCWMIENLRLIPSSTSFTASNTNSPTSDFITAAANSSTSDTLCKGDTNVSCINSVNFNSNAINRELTPSYNNNGIRESWYSYGVMYSWYTATAGNGTYSMDTTNAQGDICPAGWRLPTGGNSGEYKTLSNLVSIDSTNLDAGVVKFPLNFNYSGDYNNTKPGGRHSYGRYWSATNNTTAQAYRFGLAPKTFTPAGAYSKWDAFAVRCIVKK